MRLLILLMVIDTIFGWVKSMKKKEWRSCSAKWGIVGKVCEILIVSLVYLLGKELNIDLFYPLLLAYFDLVEIGSIIENYCEINNNIPPFIIDVINRYKTNISSKIEQFFKDKK